MVRHYLKSQFFVLLFGGVIGPIYLIVYFAFLSPADRQYVGWLLWAGWLITVADVLVALAVANYRAKSTVKTAALEQHGELALARITGMKGTGTEINDQPLVKLALQIAGPGFAFDTQKKEILQLLKANGIRLTSPLDLRSADPAVRRQFQDVVRRAAAVQPPPAFAAGPGVVTDRPGFAPPRPSAAQRLQELAGLHANEAITDDEYEEKRRQIISEI